MPMLIEFPQNIDGIATPNTTVQIPVRVNGNPVMCEISAEALQDHFGAQGHAAAVLVAAFGTHRVAIQQATRIALEANGGQPVLLKTADF